MNRLLVNAGTPQAWEIQLKPGVNRIGRGEDNDFVINHQSVARGATLELSCSHLQESLKNLIFTDSEGPSEPTVEESIDLNGPAPTAKRARKPPVRRKAAVKPGTV